jgi:hypothetical protein
MPHRKQFSESVQDRVAQLAVAQFLLFEAAVESLSMLGEHLYGLQPVPVDRNALAEPFRARYGLMRDMLREPPPHH